MSPLLSGDAGQLDVVIEEGSLWDPIFHQLVEGGTEVTDEHVPFDEGTTAYAAFRYSHDGEVLIQLGPAADNLDGTLTVDDDGGTISASLPPLESIGVEFPRLARGVWDLVVYHGGEATRAKRFLEGAATYRRRSTPRPTAP